MKRISLISLGAAVALLLLGMVGGAFAQNAQNGNAPLIHVGPNLASCGDGSNPYPGPASGVVNVHFNKQQNRLKVNVSVHDALPNTSYAVDIRCWKFGPHNSIGVLTTNSQGTGTFTIDLAQDTAPPVFYIDISVPNATALIGAYGWGDTFIAGPFNLQ
jgi:hypothetical protein